MNQASPASLTPSVVIGLLRQYRYFWIAPTLAGLLLAAFFSLVTPRMWSASQGLIIRSEAAGYANQRLGKFTDLSEMKTVQETMLELARSRSVVTAVLNEVGETNLWGKPVAPSRSDIAKFRKRLSITPPGGAEFGNTEVFYVEVKDNSPERAERLTSALVDQLEHRLQSLQNEQAGSMVSELERGVHAAEGLLAKEVQLLSAFESKQGPLLSELRNLIASNGNQSTIEQQTGVIEQELRSLDAGRRRNEQLLATLRSADQHPERLLATPSSLLASQPTLLRLKEGLVNAQIRAAALLGTRSAEHPLVQAAVETQQNLREEINRQAPDAVRGVEMELAVANAREDSLRTKLATLHATQSGLGKQRAEYAVLLGNVQNQTRVVDAARKQLADAQAHRAGALGASVLARIDHAEAGLYPIGPGRTSVTLAGGLAGLLAGLGSVFFFFAPKPASWANDESAAKGVAQGTPAPAPVASGSRAPRRESLTTSNGVTFDANPLNLPGSVYAGS